MLDYIRDGAAIYKESFATIRRETDLSGIPQDIEKVAVRIVHACGMTDIVRDLAFSRDAGMIGRRTLASGAPIFCDARMVSEGITLSRLPTQNEILCTLHDERVPEIARSIGNTRSAAALDLWGERLAGSVVVIGNAPTALFRLLELIQDGAPRPALVLGFAVGFIGAAESKAMLAANTMDIPYIVVHGRRGGSAMAAAAVNALATEIE